jgi:hypothetical protein
VIFIVTSVSIPDLIYRVFIMRHSVLQIALYGELALEEAWDLSSDRLLNE